MYVKLLDVVYLNYISNIHLNIDIIFLLYRATEDKNKELIKYKCYIIILVT